MPKFNKTPAHEPSGIRGAMPKPPGNAKAGQPPRREEAGGELPRWLDSSKAKWTKESGAAHPRKGLARLRSSPVHSCRTSPRIVADAVEEFRRRQIHGRPAFVLFWLEKAEAETADLGR